MKQSYLGTKEHRTTEKKERGNARRNQKRVRNSGCRPAPIERFFSIIPIKSVMIAPSLVINTLAVFIFSLFFFLPSAWAENYTGDFLTNGIGGRALGLGGAYVSIADDVTAAYWNPAGITTIPSDVQISLMRTARRSGLGTFNYVGVVNRASSFLALGASWINAGVDDIPIFEAFDPNIGPSERRNVARFRPNFEPTGLLSDSENAYILTVAGRLAVSQDWWDNLGRESRPPEFMIGVNAKRITQSLIGTSADGVGFDVGVLVRLLDTNAIFGVNGLGGLAFGVNVQDIADTTLKWNTESEREETIPTNAKFGVCYHNDQFFSRRLVIAYEYQTRFGGESHFGVEYQLNQPLTLRAGIRAGDFTGGVGLQINRFRLDYALLNNDLVNTHFLSLLANF